MSLQTGWCGVCCTKFEAITAGCLVGCYAVSTVSGYLRFCGARCLWNVGGRFMSRNSVTSQKTWAINCGIRSYAFLLWVRTVTSDSDDDVIQSCWIVRMRIGFYNLLLKLRGVKLIKARIITGINLTRFTKLGKLLSTWSGTSSFLGRTRNCDCGYHLSSQDGLITFLRWNGVATFTSWCTLVKHRL